MKRILRPLLLLAALAALMSISALADDETQKGTGFYDIEKVDGVTVTPDVAENTAVVWGTDNTGPVHTLYDGSQKLTVRLTGSNPAGHYLILVTTAEQMIGDSEHVGIAAENIYYINQVDTDSAGTVTFENVYPKELAASGETQNANIFIVSNAGVSKKIALSYANDVVYVEPEFRLGYVNDDDVVDSDDAMLALKIFVGSYTATPTQLKAAEVTGDDVVDSDDAMEMLKYFVGSITQFSAEK